MSKYQGYPYVNRIVNDVPTIDPATASQWAHLPRKPIQPPLPGSSSSGAGPSRDNIPSSSQSRPSVAQKKPDDEDENPVVYIDLPSPDDSDVCTSIEMPSREPEYVENTVLYDPFDNKRIDVGRKDDADSSSSDAASNDRTSPTFSSPQQPTQSSSSRGPYDPQPSGSRPTPPQSLPSFMEKESLIYGGHGANEFPLSPIPISEFPEPPPAYTELAPSPSIAPQSPTPVPEPPRTQVILPSPDPVNSSDVLNCNPSNRKFLKCQHCNTNVHTLVIKENGTITYIIAIILFCIFMPLVFIAFCSDCLKEKTHYCPNCSKRIGFEVPIVGTNIHFEKPSNSLY